MDAKYVELRGVLNETRMRYQIEINKYLQESNRLRVKWERETQNAMPIEYVPLPGGSSRRKTKSAPGVVRSLLGDGIRKEHRSASAAATTGGNNAGFVAAQFYPPPPDICPPPVAPQDDHTASITTASSAATPQAEAEPWSDEKLLSFQSKLEIQKSQQSGRPLMSGYPNSITSVASISSSVGPTPPSSAAALEIPVDGDIPSV